MGQDRERGEMDMFLGLIPLNYIKSGYVPVTKQCNMGRTSLFTIKVSVLIS